jgi:uncharacterized protein (DUF1499 family)
MKSLPGSLLTLALLLSLLCALGAVLSGFGTRLGWWDFRMGFTVLRWSVYLLAVPVGLMVVSVLLAAIAGTGVKDIRYAAVLALSLAVFGMPYSLVSAFRQAPTWGDATTSFTDPPRFVALVPIREQTASNPLAYRGAEAAELQRQYFPEITTLHTRRTPAEAVTAAAAAARKMGLEIVAEVPGDGRLEATATTFWFGFKDDVVVRARRLDDGRTEVDIRSASRVGRIDGGVNARRVQRLLHLLATEK